MSRSFECNQILQTHCDIEAVSVAQVHHGGTGPGHASPWRAEGPRLEDHQRAPGLRGWHLGFHYTADVRQPSALRSLMEAQPFKGPEGPEGLKPTGLVSPELATPPAPILVPSVPFALLFFSL